MKTITTKSLLIIISLYAAIYHPTTQSAAQGDEPLLPDNSEYLSPHILDDPLSLAAFHGNLDAVQQALDDGANPNRVCSNESNYVCNNKVTECFTRLCSSNTQSIIPTRLIYLGAIYITYGLIGNINYISCTINNNRYHTFCANHPNNYYCGYPKTEDESWQTLCNHSSKIPWCDPTTYTNYEWIQHCLNSTSPENSACYPLTKPHEPWGTYCSQNIFDMDKECAVPQNTFKSCDLTSLLSHNAIGLFCATLIGMRYFKRDGQDGCCWKKNINYSTDHKTPLMIAAQKIAPRLPEHDQIIQLLLQSKAHIDATDHYGNTALMLAIANNNANAVEILCLAGADTRGINISGKIPLTKASRTVKKIIRTIKQAQTEIHILEQLLKQKDLVTYIPHKHIVHEIVEYCFPFIDDTSTMRDAYTTHLIKLNKRLYRPHNQAAPDGSSDEEPLAHAPTSAAAVNYDSLSYKGALAAFPDNSYAIQVYEAGGSNDDIDGDEKEAAAKHPRAAVDYTGRAIKQSFY